MGLFDKKFCSVCGGKIGFLGNRKLDDGNLCKDCAAKLSPWFSERRSSTVSQIKEQLAYREENRAALAQFHTTRTLGRNTKVLIDEDKCKFVVTSARDLVQANPDILDFDQVTACRLDVDEDKTELKQKDKDGRSVSYNPPRYEYDYDFFVVINVNHPYFDEIKFRLNSSSVKTGERSISQAAPFAQRMASAKAAAVAAQVGVPNVRINTPFPEYNEYMEVGQEIVSILTKARQQVREAAKAASAPKAAVTCPWCGATTIPDAAGCCEYCGGSLNG